MLAGLSIKTSSALSATHRLSQSRCSLISTDKVFCGYACENLQPPLGRVYRLSRSALLKNTGLIFTFIQKIVISPIPISFLLLFSSASEPTSIGSIKMLHFIKYDSWLIFNYSKLTYSIIDVYLRISYCICWEVPHIAISTI